MQRSIWKKGLVAAAAASLAMLAGTQASATVVGGVDFGANATTTGFLANSSVYETLITGDGQTLRGYGQILAIAGAVDYTPSSNESLYFTFGGYTSAGFGANNVGFTGGWVEVYKGTTFNLTTAGSEANLTTISGLTPFVRLIGHTTNDTGYTLAATGLLTGATIIFSGGGLLDVDSGWGIAAVESFLDTNTLADGNTSPGFADIQYSSTGGNPTAGLNPNDTCSNASGQWCISGSAQLRGVGEQAVPEPASLALVGLGLLGLAGVKRRRQGDK